MATKPVLYVLAGVNGAGKSSIGGEILARQGLSWFNPDDLARSLVQSGHARVTADQRAWQEGLRRLDAAIADHHSHAFETTLGGAKITSRLLAATATHDVLIWFCSLNSPEEHLARIRIRVEAGGHDIGEADVRRRWRDSFANLTRLVPKVAGVNLYDNSRTVAVGAPLLDPVLVARITHGKLVYPSPRDLAGLARVPDWAKPPLARAVS